MAVQNGGEAREAAPGAAEEVDAVIDFCARAQLGMPYAEHAASLAVGTAVTWTVIIAVVCPDGTWLGIEDEKVLAGTILQINHERDLDMQKNNPFEVEAASGKRGWFGAAHLRLA